MTYLLAILGGALLFALFGLVRRWSRVGEGCSACTTNCAAKESPHGHA